MNPVTLDEKMIAREEGRKAYWRGAKGEDNPYTNIILRSNWTNGWLDAAGCEQDYIEGIRLRNE
jgi:ribosome modulation factor